MSMVAIRMSKELEIALNERAKQNNISRSDYIRMLIENDLENNIVDFQLKKNMQLLDLVGALELDSSTIKETRENYLEEKYK